MFSFLCIARTYTRCWWHFFLFYCLFEIVYLKSFISIDIRLCHVTIDLMFSSMNTLLVTISQDLAWRISDEGNLKRCPKVHQSQPNQHFARFAQRSSSSGGENPKCRPNPDAPQGQPGDGGRHARPTLQPQVHALIHSHIINISCMRRI